VEYSRYFFCDELGVGRWDPSRSVDSSRVGLPVDVRRNAGAFLRPEFSKPITDADLKDIEKTMRKILPTWDKFERFELTADEAKKEYPGNQYKHELIDEFTKDGQKVTFYKSGDYWDLCKGGHAESMKDVPADCFKLDKIAGAYWRGNEKNAQLTRIYGLAFATKADLDAYITQQEEAEKRRSADYCRAYAGRTAVLDRSGFVLSDKVYSRPIQSVYDLLFSC
jgi:hypothetical protein